MPNACFFEIPVLDTRIEAERCSVRCPSGVNEGSLQAAQCAEDSARYNKTAAIGLVGLNPRPVAVATALPCVEVKSTSSLVDIGLVGFEPTASWSRTRRSTKLSHSPK